MMKHPSSALSLSDRPEQATLQSQLLDSTGEIRLREQDYRDHHVALLFFWKPGTLGKTRVIFLYPDLPKSNGVVVFTAMFRRELREIKREKKGELR